MSRDVKGPRLTVPELAKHFGISDQTVRRWVKRNQVPSTRNADGWALIRPDDVPADLLEATKKLSGARYKAPEPAVPVDPWEEIAWLRSQLEKLLAIIAQLSEGDGDDMGLSGGGHTR